VSELWPHEFRATVEVVFGKSLNRTSFELVNRRVVHAFDVWRRRYEMNPAQDQYAWEVLAWAVRHTGESVAQMSDVRSPYVYLRRAVSIGMERVVNDPRVHNGFKRRAGLVDVTELLKGAFA